MSDKRLAATKEINRLLQRIADLEAENTHWVKELLKGKIAGKERIAQLEEQIRLSKIENP